MAPQIFVSIASPNELAIGDTRSECGGQKGGDASKAKNRLLDHFRYKLKVASLFMQIFAFDEREELISALAAVKKKDYTCPECQGVVRTRLGQLRRAHFYHIQTNTECRLQKKTAQHLIIQLYFEKILPKCSLEVPFPDIKRIADCVWESEKIIFEIQCSYISQEEIKKRNEDYGVKGYRVIWVLHDKTFNQRRATPAETYLQKWPHFYSNIDLQGNGFIYDQYTKIKAHRFIEKTKAFQIDPSQVQKVPRKITIPQRKQWWVSFKGDLLEDPSKIKLEKMEVKKRSLKHLLAMFWDAMLRKTCQ